MTVRLVRCPPVDIDDFDATDPFIPAAMMTPMPYEEIAEEAALAERHGVLKRWLVRALVFAFLVSVFWLFGWAIVGAWLGWLMAGVGGVALLPYILMIDWKV